MNRIIRISPYVFALLTIATIALTLLPAKHFESAQVFTYDKFGHFILFFAWTLSFGMTAFFKHWSKFAHLAAVFVASVLFGLAIEIAQRLLPVNRAFEWADLAADGLGSLAAIGLLYLLRKKYGQLYQNKSLSS